MHDTESVAAPDRIQAADLRLARALVPARSFDRACDLVLDYLRQEIPMGVWSVTRITGDRQLMLSVTDDGSYGMEAGHAVPLVDTMCRYMVSGEAPRIAPDVSLVPQYQTAADRSGAQIKTYVGTPIVQPDGSLFGSVCGFDPERRPESLQSYGPLLDVLSSLLSSVLEADLRATDVARDLETARRDSETDALTGLLNRRGWDRYVVREEERFRRFGDDATVIVMDLDNLKTVNDVRGHDAGDDYIRSAARVLESTVRSGDVLARLGGDEFGIIAVGATAEQAEGWVERAERELERAGVSGSFGHAPYSIVAGFPGAWKAADEAMYVRKRMRRAAR
ncbi:sensor domain-containing diguanylate cyclase [Pseudonocardia pini]|uniref:sensor domain-containing diguanylate cyclase n=1 Tax=Pseudonocardia pini TaxID=2758030 RepID=UPI0015F0E3E4|nr:sensor domain-containing diguanylate cyclase [Pseudonocardia pini]